MSFSNEMLRAKKKLENLGHMVELPCDVELHLDDPNFIDDLEADYQHCLENDIMRKCFELVAASEAILVLNYPKNNISGYIGTSSLMEIGLAYYLNKKIFLLHKIPKSSKVRWAHEVEIMQPAILDGDLKKIK